MLGAALRFAALDAQSFWYDEAFTANIATNASAAELLSGRIRDNGNPPLYWLIARGWSNLFGTSEAAWRSFPALCSTLAIPFVYLVGRRIASESAGLLAAFLFAISQCALELADEARCYALLQFLAVLSTWLFLRWHESGTSSSLAAYSLSIVAIALTHYFGFAVPVVHATALLAGRPDRRRIAGFAIGMVCAAALFSFWLPSFLAQLTTKGNLARMGAGWKLQFIGTPIVFAFGRMLAWKGSPNWQLAGGSAAAVFCLWLPACCALWGLRRDWFKGILLGGWWLLPILGPLLVAVLFSPIYATRYGTVGLPALLILAAIGLTNWPRTLAAPAVLVVVALSGLSFSNYLTRPIKPDWRQAAAIVRHAGSESEAVVLDSDIENLPFRYYFRNDPAFHRPLYGITSASDGDSLQGIAFRGHERLDKAARPLDEDLLGLPGFWIALCESTGTLDQYRAKFIAAGFSEVECHELYRISLCRFVRSE